MSHSTISGKHGKKVLILMEGRIGSLMIQSRGRESVAVKLLLGFSAGTQQKEGGEKKGQSSTLRSGPAESGIWLVENVW